MKLATALACLLLVAACGTDDGGRATDPAASSPSAAAPTAPSTGGIPPAAGPVTTRGLATVMDTGRPELCLGPVADSFPPQCRGIPLQGWDWSQHREQYDVQGDVRWGEFAVTGTFDGTTMHVTGAVPSAVYDPAEPADVPMPTGDAGTHGPDQAGIERKLREHPMPGTLSVYPTPAGVVVEVVHDDGSLQARADAAYGPGAVAVVSMLVPVNR